MKFLKESNAIEGVYDNYSFHQAKRAWEYLIEQDQLTEEVVLKTHFILMKNKLSPDKRGHFRTVPVYIGGKEARHYSLIKSALKTWLYFMNAEHLHEGLDERTKGYHIMDDHVGYEKIHPFIDGNGRTGRMFMNWQRSKAGLPILVIKESEKQEYYKWFI